MIQYVVIPLCLGVVVSSVLALNPPRNDHYWEGWCAGRRAGLEHASQVVHSVLDEVRQGLVAEGRTEAVQRLDTHLLLEPMVSFGPPLGEPYTVTLPSGEVRTCPEGLQQQAPVPLPHRG
jgi:hypothetical protein